MKILRAQETSLTAQRGGRTEVGEARCQASATTGAWLNVVGSTQHKSLPASPGVRFGTQVLILSLCTLAAVAGLPGILLGGVESPGNKRSIWSTLNLCK